MKRQYYKITLHTRDIFNFTTAVLIRQYDHNPEILSVYDSEEGQLVDLKVCCTANEMLIMKVSLADYILRVVKIGSNNRELSIWERIGALWTQNTMLYF